MANADTTRGSDDVGVRTGRSLLLSRSEWASSIAAMGLHPPVRKLGSRSTVGSHASAFSVPFHRLSLQIIDATDSRGNAAVVRAGTAKLEGLHGRANFR